MGFVVLVTLEEIEPDVLFKNKLGIRYHVDSTVYLYRPVNFSTSVFGFIDLASFFFCFIFFVTFSVVFFPGF